MMAWMSASVAAQDMTILSGSRVSTTKRERGRREGDLRTLMTFLLGPRLTV